MGVMNCFPLFHRPEKKDEIKPLKAEKDGINAVRAISMQSSDSSQNDRESNTSGFGHNSRNASATSTESSGTRNSFPNTSNRTSNIQVLTFQELRTATKCFSRCSRLGEGGFGCVYKGAIRSIEDPSTKIDVAVKQLGKRGLQGHKEWVTEVNVLAVVEHPNLVKLLGYCSEDHERGIQRLLVYEYMPNGSVDCHLSIRSQTVIPWARRLRIAQDAARGLAYLHEGMDFQIIFRDFKSSNILLDEEWNAKLSDFGLARLGPEEGLTHVTTDVVGTLGYAAPEYIRTGHLTAKIDVWSYGVFLYELITGRRPLDKTRPQSEQNLLDWVKPYLSDMKKFRLIVDPRLERKYSLKCVYKLSIVANRCLVTQPKARPKMSDVLEMVNLIVESCNESENGSLVVKNLLKRAETTEGKVLMRAGDGGFFARWWSPKRTKVV